MHKVYLPCLFLYLKVSFLLPPYCIMRMYVGMPHLVLLHHIIGYFAIPLVRVNTVRLASWVKVANSYSTAYRNNYKSNPLYCICLVFPVFWYRDIDLLTPGRTIVYLWCLEVNQERRAQASPVTPGPFDALAGTWIFAFDILFVLLLIYMIIAIRIFPYTHFSESE